MPATEVFEDEVLFEQETTTSIFRNSFLFRMCVANDDSMHALFLLVPFQQLG